jgi:hypothetical protein
MKNSNVRKNENENENISLCKEQKKVGGIKLCPHKFLF